MSAAPAASAPWRIEFDRTAQLKAGLIALAFVAVFWDLWPVLIHPWMHEADWSHGPIIPLFSAYLIYMRWDQVRRAPIRHTWVGLALMIAAVALYQYTIWGLRVGYIKPISMLLCLLGVAIFLCGLPVLRHVWLPWLYLLFAIPLPKGVYFALTDPLRRMAATVATAVLSLVPDLTIQRSGSTIEYFYQGQYDGIDVADACSGMRSTITLCALGVAVAFMSERPWWQRIIMVAACIPIATLCNFIRVTVTCWLHIFVDPAYATGQYHTALGLVLLLVAFGLFSLLGWALSNLFVEEREPADTPA